MLITTLGTPGSGGSYQKKTPVTVDCACCGTVLYTSQGWKQGDDCVECLVWWVRICQGAA